MGNKQRQAPVTNGALHEFEIWLGARGDAPGAVVRSDQEKRWDRGGEALDPEAVFNLLTRRGEESDVRAFSPHDMRRCFISDLPDAGADIATA